MTQLSQDFNNLPSPIQNQIGAYLHKQLPAYCQIRIFADGNAIEPLDNSVDIITPNSIIEYRISRHGENKYIIRITGEELGKFYIYNYNAFILSNGATPVRLYIDRDYSLVFMLEINLHFPERILLFNANQVCVFKQKYYMNAFITMLKDLYSRIIGITKLNEKSKAYFEKRMAEENAELAKNDK